MTTNEKIALLRKAMQNVGADALLIPSSDPHASEYLPDHWAARSYFSGFTGSVGTFVVTTSGSALWVDGRYFIQAERQLAGSEVQLQRMGLEGVPTVEEYIAEEMGQNQVLALDGMSTPTSMVQKIQAAVEKKNITIKSVDLITPCWEGRPPVPATEAFLLDEKYCGFSAKEKLAQLREKLAEKNADAEVVTRLDSVAWLLNLRAKDIECTPFAMAYCIVAPDKATLFINKARLPKEAEDKLNTQGVTVVDYDTVIDAIRGCSEKLNVLVDAESSNWEVYSAVKANPNLRMVECFDPIMLMKEIKNETEIRNIRAVHAKDGVAMVRFQMWLEKKMAAGEKVTELDVANKLLELRSSMDLYVDLSFTTISAYGANAAMMHYHATEDNYSTLEPHGFLLVDSGGHYMDGTTDITRTYTLGELTEHERTYYTYVLKSHIDIAKFQFTAGCTCGNLDAIARGPVWAHGFDYRCGTGHGVGFLGCVHEGPHGFRLNNKEVLKPGMTVTDEPGIYEEGEVGIRIENEMVCELRQKNEYGQFLGFETVTYCPIDLTPVRPELLDQDEKDWLNAFHKTTYDTLKPLLTEEEAAWLAEKTRPLA